MPSCFSIIHHRYLGTREQPVPSGSALWLPLAVCHFFLHLIQACKNNICLDLSPGHGLDGRLTGHRVETWNVKVRTHISLCVWSTVWSILASSVFLLVIATPIKCCTFVCLFVLWPEF